MHVLSFMTPTPITVLPDEDVEVAWERMATIDARHLPVVDGDELVGIVSDRDLAERSDVSVREVMSTDPVTVRPDDDLVHAGQLLLSHRISALPVVEGGRLVGVITTTNCLTAMIQLHHELEQAKG